MNALQISHGMKCCGCTLMALITLGPLAAHADLIIDNFQDAQSLGIAGAPAGYGSNFQAMATAGVLGGERDLFVERTSGNSGSIAVDINGSFTDALAFASSPATTGQSLITYDGVDGVSGLDYTGLLGLDLTEGGLNQGILLGTTSDLGAAATFSIFTDATHFSMATLPILADPSFTFTSYFVAWADFTAAGVDGGADFTNVGAITLQLNGTANPGVDIGVNYFAATVPEPAGAVLLILSGVVSVAGRRRKAQKS